MSMYNMIFGKNPMSNALLAIVGLTQGDFARFRDCHVDGDTIAVYTRLGGGNRACYCGSGEEHSCYQANIAELQAHPLYVRDEDDDFDSTYATFYFRIPVEMLAGVAGLIASDESPPPQKWERFLADLRAGTQTPEVKRATEGLAPILKAISEQINP